MKSICDEVKKGGEVKIVTFDVFLRESSNRLLRKVLIRMVLIVIFRRKSPKVTTGSLMGGVREMIALLLFALFHLKVTIIGFHPADFGKKRIP